MDVFDILAERECDISCLWDLYVGFEQGVDFVDKVELYHMD